MQFNDTGATYRIGGLAAIGGAVTMLIGAVLWGTSGTDLWAALNENTMSGYLADAGAVKAQLVANLSFWILGVLILGVAGSVMVALGERNIAARAAQVCFSTAVPLAIISFIAMLSVVVQLAPDTSATTVAIAETVGWIGARADDLATALIVGAGPFFLALAARDAWMPAWLARWGYLAGLIGLFSVAVLYIPAFAALGFLIIPIGLGWMIAAGIVLQRRARADR